VIPLRDNVPTRSFPVVTVALIAANFVVWFWELGGRGVDYHVAKDGYYPCTVNHHCVPIEIGGAVFRHHLPWYEGTFTSMFMHGSWIHILGNMLFLWIFGNNVEDALGKVRFLLWYLAAGVAAVALQTFVTLDFGTRTDASIPNIGASGAIAGVLGAYFVLLPRARVLTVIFFGIILIREIPAVWFLGVWIALQAWSGGIEILHPQSGGGTAFFAHIGGFAFGAATIRLVARRRPSAPVSRYPVW
jgi:membrane associated rhomboid family serine protease